MRPKYIVIAIIAFIAYTYGAKAGTPRYKQIMGRVDSVWNDPKVKKARKKAAKNAAKGRKVAAKRAKRKFG